MLAVWRYFRLFVNLYSFWQYEPARPPRIQTIYRKDITMIIPTVSVSKPSNPDFEECITTCLFNLPAKIIIVTDTDSKVLEVKKQLLNIYPKIQDGSSGFLNGLGPIDISKVGILVISAGIANKRQQIKYAVEQVQTRLIMFLDDHVFLRPYFLDFIIPVFENPCVGLCGTKKMVRRENSKAHTPWGKYWESFWNVIGILYLERHNFEIRATNAMDGGVFVVSGRAMIILAEIVQDERFLQAFVNEYFFFGLIGPLNPDDDNFIRRWVLRHPKSPIKSLLFVYRSYCMAPFAVDGNSSRMTLYIEEPSPQTTQLLASPESFSPLISLQILNSEETPREGEHNSTQRFATPYTLVRAFSPKSDFDPSGISVASDLLTIASIHTQKVRVLEIQPQPSQQDPSCSPQRPSSTPPQSNMILQLYTIPTPPERLVAESKDIRASIDKLEAEIIKIYADKSAAKGKPNNDQLPDGSGPNSKATMLVIERYGQLQHNPGTQKIDSNVPIKGSSYYYLATIARPHSTRQLFYCAKSLCTAVPFVWARESITSLLKPVLSMTSHRLPLLDTVYFQAYGQLFISRDIAKFNMTKLEFLGTKGSKQAYPPDEELFRYAQSFFNSTIEIVLRRISDPNILSFLHVNLAFLYGISRQESDNAKRILMADFPWGALAAILNILLQSIQDASQIGTAQFPSLGPANNQPLPEDFALRGLLWTEKYFPTTWFDNWGEFDEEGWGNKSPSLLEHQKRRIVWLGYCIAQGWSSLTYSSNPPHFASHLGRSNSR
ncbi:hypothetical protein B7494_g7851 [Chlorociboria aeruginascens]|nr:hypothetical protein B7494_g7851 [Chlorociboria aeruginascens]